MQDIKEEEIQEIKTFFNELQSFFEGWFNGTIPLESLEEFVSKLDLNWKLINKETPKVINDKKIFVDIWPRFHGQFKDTPIKKGIEIISIEKMSDEYFLVLQHDITIMSDETKSRPVTTILKRDSNSGYLVYLVHE